VTGSTDKGGKAEREPTQSERLIRYVDDAELFHTPDGAAHATFTVGNHKETWPLKSRRFNQWLLRQYYEQHGKPPSAQAKTDALATIGARADFEGEEKPVYVRVAGHCDTVYLDLCNSEWEAVEITPSDWRVVPSKEVPVKFVRKDNAAPLPHPISGGTVERLKRFLNVKTDEDFILVVAWIIGTFNPDGPYPPLVLEGEQGSAKSTTVRVARSLTDPAVEPLRAPPRNERDLAIAASGNWTPALDNLSGVRPWLSDALCRLATGGGFATRELYSDDREVIFSQKRPVIVNGIDSLAVAGDLRDRSITIDLPPIPQDKRRTEKTFYRELDDASPQVLGALLDAVSYALRNRNRIELKELPRMADFAVWVAAAEEALGWEQGAFMRAYAGNRSEANEMALANDPVAGAVGRLLDRREEWSGTATEMLKELGKLVSDEVKRSKAWPAAPNALSNRLKRLAPGLRDIGIEYSDRSIGHGKTKIKTLRKVKETIARTDRIDGEDKGNGASVNGHIADEMDEPALHRSLEIVGNERLADGAGDAVGQSRAPSESAWSSRFEYLGTARRLAPQGCTPPSCRRPPVGGRSGKSC
jgi:hypothetical protein